MASLVTPLRAHRSLVAAILLLGYLPACHSWHTGTPAPAEFIQREHPHRIRVTRLDRSQVVLAAPKVEGDSLYGQRETVTPKGEVTTGDFAIPLADVHSVAVRDFSPGKTFLLVGGIVGVYLLAWVIDCSGRSGWDSLGCP
jgi:hypothetical protein